MKKRWLCLLLLLLLCLAACGGEKAESAADPEPETENAAQPSPEPTPEPSPDPAAETLIRLCRDPLPEGLQMLSYAACVNSTKEAQTYIDTGIVPTNDTRFFLDFECPTGFVVKDTWFFGCFDRDKHMYMEVGYHMGQGNAAGFYTATGVHYSQYRDSAARTVAWFHPGDYVYRNIVTNQSFREFEEPVKQHLFLFSRQHMDMEIAGTHDIESQYELRIYACRIWQDGVLVRDYLPCLCQETGRVGMYEMVEGRVYYSDGSEELLAGPAFPPEGSALALDGEIQGSISVPRMQGFFFRGFYTEKNGEGEKIIDENGEPCARVEPASELTLYAFYERDESVFDRY